MAETTLSLFDLLSQSIWTMLVVSLPVLLVAMSVGLLIGILQTTTSIQEQTLTFVPKILTILGMIALLATWMITVLREYFVSLMNLIPQLVR